MENVFVRYPKKIDGKKAILSLLFKNSELLDKGEFEEIIILQSVKNEPEYNREILAELSFCTAQKKLFVIPDLTIYIDSLNNEIESKFFTEELINLACDSKFIVGIPVTNGSNFGHLGQFLEKKSDSIIYLNNKARIISQWNRTQIKFK